MFIVTNPTESLEFMNLLRTQFNFSPFTISLLLEGPQPPSTRFYILVNNSVGATYCENDYFDVNEEETYRDEPRITAAEALIRLGIVNPRAKRRL